MAGFLYGQTEYNLLNNAIHLDDYFLAVKKAKYTFASITDNNLAGYYKFYFGCQSRGLKAVIGLEIIDENPNYTDYYAVYALDDLGIEELVYITSKQNTKKDFKALDFLLKHNDHVAVILNCSKSFCQVFDSASSSDIINRLAHDFAHFYLGISCQSEVDKELNNFCYTFGKQNNIGLLPIHQTLYFEKNDQLVYEYLTIMKGTNIKINENSDYSFPLDISSEFSCYPDLLSLQEAFVNSIHYNLFKQKISLPKYPNTKGMKSDAFLASLCQKGLIRRVGSRFPQIDKYTQRIEYELSIIHQMGYDDYFLIVWDFILFAKQNSILVGPGRGSAAGSLVAYCLGITDVDPIRFDLLFERFLNPERISMPDIDTDFPDDKRDLVIDHVKNLYGEDHVCNITAFGTFLIKSSIRDLGRVMKIESGRLDELIDLATKTENYDELLSQFIERRDLYDLLYIAKKMANLPKHIGTHAAGIILSEEPLTKLIPLQTGINGLYQSQLEAYDLGKIGLLKMDFLGIRNLSIIANVLDDIKVLNQKTIKHIPLDDSKTYGLYQKADTLGIFQMESEGIRRFLIKLKPNCFEDIVAVLALYRPGPMDNINEYIERRNGKPYEILHPDLKGVLSKTYGIIIYQEQIMQIALIFAGYSLGQADLLRRAVSKKDETALQKERSNFVTSSMNKGYSSEVANRIYDYIVKFANYGFNRSHSVAYAFLSYQMAYLKANYFKSFIARISDNVIGNSKALASYIIYAKHHQLNCLSPSINYSDIRFLRSRSGLLIPLTAIYTVGESISKSIIEERKNGLFTSFSDFRNRCDFVNNRICEALIYAGCFDEFNQSKKSLFENIDAKTNVFDRHLDDVISDNSEYDIAYLAEQEKAYLGFNIAYDPYKDILLFQKQYHTIPIGEGRLNEYVSYLGYINDFKLIITKNDTYMAVGEVTDDSGSLPFVVFPKCFEFNKDFLTKKNLLLINGRLSENEKTNKLQIIIETFRIVK